MWDVFISHAREDKDAVARPLAEALGRAGLRVWLDEHQLRMGDSLRAKIDEGLAGARFGVVVLSKAFFSKDWPQRELNGLAAREDQGRKVILPIWHDVDHDFITRYSPTLADRLAVKSSDGVSHMKDEILAVVRNSSDAKVEHVRAPKPDGKPTQSLNEQTTQATRPDVLRLKTFGTEVLSPVSSTTRAPSNTARKFLMFGLLLTVGIGVLYWVLSGGYGASDGRGHSSQQPTSFWIYLGQEDSGNLVSSRISPAAVPRAGDVVRITRSTSKHAPPVITNGRIGPGEVLKAENLAVGQQVVVKGYHMYPTKDGIRHAWAEALFTH